MKACGGISLLSMALGVCLLAFGAAAVDGADVAAKVAALVKPSDSRILCLGRSERSNPEKVLLSWPGSGVAVKFEGTALVALFDDVQWNKNGNRLTVELDGVPSDLFIKAGQTRYPVASNLSPGKHVLKICKASEPWLGPISFGGFELPEKSALLPPPQESDRRIEIIGDSITVGAGNEGTSKDTAGVRNTNNYFAYGPLAARMLKADCAVLAWSGKGVLRNGDGKQDGTMPKIYDRAIPTDANSRWDFSKWKPQAVAVNLCTNDCGPGVPEAGAFTAAYNRFIDEIRSKYPDVHVFCCLGPMLNDSWPKGEGRLSKMREILKAMVEGRAIKGDRKVHFVEFDPQREGGIGGSWHPNVATHKIMAEKLAKAISKEMKWSLPESVK